MLAFRGALRSERFQSYGSRDALEVRRIRASEVGEPLEFVTLRSGRRSCIGLDLFSGALLEAFFATPLAEDGEVPVAFTVVHGEIVHDPEPADPSRPERVVLAEAPAIGDVIGGRALDRLLAATDAPLNSPLLGYIGSGMPFEDLDGMRPSLCTVRPRAAELLRTRTGSMCNVVLGDAVHELPVADPRVAMALDQLGTDRIDTRVFERATGFGGDRLVVGLLPPDEGWCAKGVLALVPKP